MKLTITHRQKQIVALLSLFIGTLLLCSSSTQWIAAAFAGMHDQFNLIILFALILVIFNQLKQNRFSWSRAFSMELNPWAVLLYGTGLVAYCICRISIDINLLSACSFGILLYALIGFYLHPTYWKRLAIPTFLILLTLPFGNLMDTYLGFPLRMVAADFVHQLLQALGYHSINTETIITLENQSTQINMNCSGMKGLWAAWIYFFTLCWLYKIRIGLKWLSTLLFSTALILFFNLMRIVVLVLVELVLDQKELADAIHTPLGLAGFVLSCLITWSMVYYWLKQSRESKSKEKTTVKKVKWEIWGYIRPYFNRFATSILLIALVVLIGINPSPSIAKAPFAKPTMTFPEAVVLSDVPLTENEYFFFAKDACFPIKKHFKYKDLEGSFLCVFNASFRGHHHPEACMQGAGFEFGEATTLLIEEQFPVKKIALNDDTLTATYWFQAPAQITEDYSSRVWLELLGKQQKWVMVSILFNQEIKPKNEDYREFLKIMSTQINNNLLTIPPHYEAI